MIFAFESPEVHTSTRDNLWQAASSKPDTGGVPLCRVAAHHVDAHLDADMTPSSPPPHHSLSAWPPPEASSSRAPAHHPHATSPSPDPTPDRADPPLQWQTAAQDSLDGVHYTREAFPTAGLSYLAAPFSREPLTVPADERVVLLDEVSEFAVRVRVCRTGEMGLLPAWNVEGALERLARLNMLLNEQATSPKGRSHTLRSWSPMSRSPSSSRSRSSSPSPSSPSSDADSLFSSPLTPPSAPAPISLPITIALSASPSSSPTARSQALDLKAPAASPTKRRVEFARSPRRTVFRYPRLRAVPDSDSDASDVDSEGDSEDDASGADAYANASNPVSGAGTDNAEDGGSDASSGDADNAGSTARSTKLTVGAQGTTTTESGRWWWDGWEESQDVPAGPPESDAEDEREDLGRVGRARTRGRAGRYFVL
ncbi:hypothetical protein EIP86_000074 [Pleurotus ostreatoroseus]|nr:hypothetical protein EIP86_000074 [Pleurotus ostreatoroseus]